ncbi:MAG: hypothetical protein RLZZ09_3509 [Pseudomonadota bacterium]|jgi:copper chaperone CopZ
MNDSKTMQRQGYLKSHVPGRIRFKLHPAHREPGVAHDLQGKLAAMGGIHDVRVNAANGSVTVSYDHARHSMAGILGILEDLDVMVESIGHLPEIDVNGAAGPAIQPQFQIAIDDLTQRIKGATGVSLNLRAGLPLAFLAAGIWSIARRGLMIERVPGWLFLWFAFDLFVKLNSFASEEKPTG